jgi:hypothetical protein
VHYPQKMAANIRRYNRLKNESHYKLFPKSGENEAMMASIWIANIGPNENALEI